MRITFSFSFSPLLFGAFALNSRDAADSLLSLNAQLKFLNGGHANLRKYGIFRVVFRRPVRHHRGDLESYLAEGLSQGGDYADLYFEYLATSSIGIDESIVKSATQGVSLGVGVRVIAGERTGYAYSDDLSPEKIRKAARVAACIATGPANVEKTGFEEAQTAQSVSDAARARTKPAFDERVDLVKRADRCRPRLRSARVSGAGRPMPTACAT